MRLGAGLVLIVLVLLWSGVESQLTLDACYGVSVCPKIVGSVEATLSSMNISSTLQNLTDVTALLPVLYNGLFSTLSPFGFNVGLGYPDNSFVYIQRCSPYTSDCAVVDPNPYVFEVVAPQIYGDSNTRYWGVRFDNYSRPTVDILNPDYTDSDPYYCTARPWFNSTSWSPSYLFINTNAESRSYVNIINNGIRIFSDRVPEEPCGPCYARSPCVGLAGFIAGSAPLYNWQIINNNSTRILTMMQYMLKSYLQEWQIQYTINSIAVAFNATNDTYILTDCQATTASSPECRIAPYLFEARNTRVYGDDHLHAYAVDVNGNVLSTSPRDELVSYNPQVRPWYMRADGWSDNFATINVNSNTSTPILSRGYSRWFYNGVALCLANPSQICPGDIISKRNVVLDQGNVATSSASKRMSLFNLM